MPDIITLLKKNNNCQTALPLMLSGSLPLLTKKKKKDEKIYSSLCVINKVVAKQRFCSLAQEHRSAELKLMKVFFF